MADPYDLDLERDMPTTPEDVEALARARELPLIPPEEYQRLIDLLMKHHPRPHDGNAYSDEPFTL